MAHEVATFGAGCFWGVEEAFRKLPGVVETQVGYMGGTTRNPTYEEVCTDATGHAEVVEVTYDPSVTAYAALLKRFFEIHDPTTLNRQGPDVGSQYRSVIFYHDDRQREEASNFIAELTKQGAYRAGIVTGVEPRAEFWRAEEYHQRYIEKGGAAACHI